MLVQLRLPIRNGDYLIRNNRIYNNKIEDDPAYAIGGGMYINYVGSEDNGNCAPIIYNNIISDNYTPDFAGGIGVYKWGSRIEFISPLIFNNTVINNESPKSPGLDLRRVTALVVNNIFANQGNNSDTPEMFLTAASDLFFNNAIRGTEYLGQGNSNVVPVFEEDVYELGVGGPGVGAGIQSVEVEGVIYEVPKTDFYGNQRPNPVDWRVDLGAIESPYEGFVYIPDENFVNALIEEGVDLNGDGKIGFSEAESIHVLEIRDYNIDSLSGIEAFINLDTIKCTLNSLKSLNPSGSPDLLQLECGNNLIQDLNIQWNTKLLELHCGNNELSNLAVTVNTLLKKLYCQSNDIQVLNIIKNLNLEELDSYGNSLSTISLTNNLDLRYLSCGNNQIENLDISNNVQIELRTLRLRPRGRKKTNGVDLNSLKFRGLATRQLNDPRQS